MKDLIIDVFLAAKKPMLAPKRYNNFELFGYDFLIDEDLRVWLIEVILEAIIVFLVYFQLFKFILI